MNKLNLAIFTVLFIMTSASVSAQSSSIFGGQYSSSIGLGSSYGGPNIHSGQYSSSVGSSYRYGGERVGAVMDSYRTTDTTFRDAMGNRTGSASSSYNGRTTLRDAMGNRIGSDARI